MKDPICVEEYFADLTRGIIFVRVQLFLDKSTNQKFARVATSAIDVDTRRGVCRLANIRTDTVWKTVLSICGNPPVVAGRNIDSQIFQVIGKTKEL